MTGDKVAWRKNKSPVSSTQNPGGNERKKRKLKLKNRRASVVFDEFFLLQFFPFFRLENGFRAFSFSLDKKQKDNRQVISAVATHYTLICICVYVCGPSFVDGPLFVKKKSPNFFFFICFFFLMEKTVFPPWKLEWHELLLFCLSLLDTIYSSSESMDNFLKWSLFIIHQHDIAI